jgi:hypothetical protein
LILLNALQRKSLLIRKRSQRGEVNRADFSNPEATCVVKAATHLASREIRTYLSAQGDAG